MGEVAEEHSRSVVTHQHSHECQLTSHKSEQRSPEIRFQAVRSTPPPRGTHSET